MAGEASQPDRQRDRLSLPSRRELPAGERLRWGRRPRPPRLRWRSAGAGPSPAQRGNHRGRAPAAGREMLAIPPGRPFLLSPPLAAASVTFPPHHQPPPPPSRSEVRERQTVSPNPRCSFGWLPPESPPRSSPSVLCNPQEDLQGSSGRGAQRATRDKRPPPRPGGSQSLRWAGIRAPAWVRCGPAASALRKAARGGQPAEPLRRWV